MPNLLGCVAQLVMCLATDVSLTADPGLDVIKLEYILRCVRKQSIIALYFESETVLKFYNLEARGCKFDPGPVPYF